MSHSLSEDITNFVYDEIMDKGNGDSPFVAVDRWTISLIWRMLAFSNDWARMSRKDALAICSKPDRAAQVMLHRIVFRCMRDRCEWLPTLDFRKSVNDVTAAFLKAGRLMKRQSDYLYIRDNLCFVMDHPSYLDDAIRLGLIPGRSS